MKTKIALQLLLFIFSLSVTSFTTSVGTESSKKNILPSPYTGTKIICVYSFENVSNVTQIEQLKAEISLLKEVTGIKSEYKPESGRGQITVFITEPHRISESESTFDITQIKKLIISNGLTPMDVTITEESIN